ncbi:hypothetical protein GCK32_005790 [Trichostrongylus colubriformis]|uniref:Uncharacterized protein n=1 Tax=Trichostrongylus colubriformis TaxID=6319 RepID=A0AAN8FYF9_TRICO
MCAFPALRAIHYWMTHFGMVVSGAYPLALVLMLLPHDSRSLKCLQGPVPTNTSIEATGNVCVYYEMNSCENPQTYSDEMDVAEPAKLVTNCGVFHDFTSAIYAACFCRQDNCNGGATIRDFIMSTLAAPRPLPDTSPWTYMPISNRTREILECFERNMYPPDPTTLAAEAAESESSSPINIYLIAAIAGGVIVVLCGIAIVCFLKKGQKQGKGAVGEAKGKGAVGEVRGKGAGGEVLEPGDSSSDSGRASEH